MLGPETDLGAQGRLSSAEVGGDGSRMRIRSYLMGAARCSISGAFMALGLQCNSRWNVLSIIAKFPIDLKDFNCMDNICLNKNEPVDLLVRI